jgi:hypothetical protein
MLAVPSAEQPSGAVMGTSVAFRGLHALIGTAMLHR